MDFILKYGYKVEKYFFRNKSLAAQDLPSPREYRAMGLGRVSTPIRMSLFAKAKKIGMVFFMQGINSCTAFALTIARMVLDTIFNGKVPPYSPDYQWNLQLNTGGSVASGDYSQNALEQGIKDPQGYPFLYARFGRIRHQKNVDEMVKWIARHKTLYTMVYWNLGTWYAKPLLKISNYAEMLRIGWIVSVIGKRLGAHQICFGGYDKEKKLPDGTTGLAFEYYETMKKKNEGFGWISAKDLIGTGLCGNVYIISDLKDRFIKKL